MYVRENRNHQCAICIYNIKAAKPRKTPACYVHLYWTFLGEAFCVIFLTQSLNTSSVLLLSPFCIKSKGKKPASKSLNFNTKLWALVVTSRQFLFFKISWQIKCCSALARLAQQLVTGMDGDWSYSHAECGFTAVCCCFSVPELCCLLFGYRFFQLRLNKYTGLGI